MKVKSKFLKTIASCSLKGNNIKIISLTTVVIIPYMLRRKSLNSFLPGIAHIG